MKLYPPCHAELVEASSLGLRQAQADIGAKAPAHKILLRQPTDRMTNYNKTFEPVVSC